MRPVTPRTNLLLVLLAFSPSFWGCMTDAQLKLLIVASNYASFCEQVLPTQSELAWMQIPWRPSFHEGVAEAQAQGKPVLLWVMNGHPLGCT